MKMKKTVTGKKSPTNPDRKEQHEIRKYRDFYINHLQELERERELRDYINAKREIQE